MKAKTKSKANQQKPVKPMPITPTQLDARREQLIIFDVRNGLEYWLGHVPGAGRFNRSKILKQIPKDQKIALTCLSGHRSDVAAHWLVAQGYRQVYSLQGGLMAWQGAGYPVQRGLRP